MSTFGLTWNLKSPDRNKQFISNIPRMWHCSTQCRKVIRRQTSREAGSRVEFIWNLTRIYSFEPKRVSAVVLFLNIFYTILSDIFITKACLYNFDPLKPYFYVVKLGFTGVDIIFLISAHKHGLWVLVRTASQSCRPRRILLQTM